VRGNRGFREVARGAAGAERGLRVVGQPVVAVGRGLGYGLEVLEIPYPLVLIIAVDMVTWVSFVPGPGPQHVLMFRFLMIALFIGGIA
jgi:hypothetical protein